MRRQRNITQMKEQIKTPEKELNEMEISNLSDAEFRTLVIKKKKKRTLIIRMLKELSENLKSITKIQAEMKYVLVEIKNNLQGINSRVNEAENQTSNLGHKEAKNNQSEQQEEKKN